ncbi:hypothetical protein [Paenibacillus taiwanensis]|nr:hypothetical protein [Paenibacillus taiwanensis]
MRKNHLEPATRELLEEANVIPLKEGLAIGHIYDAATWQLYI